MLQPFCTCMVHQKVTRVRVPLSKHPHLLSLSLLHTLVCVQVIALIAHLVETGKAGSRPSLILVPASLMANWEGEFAAWAPALRLVAYKGNAQERQDIFAKEVWRLIGTTITPARCPAVCCSSVAGQISCALRSSAVFAYFTDICRTMDFENFEITG